MKTRNYVLTVLAIIIAVTASATKIPTLNVIPVEQHKALVAFENSKPAAVEVTVSNKLGQVLYYKKSEAPVENIRLILDFQDLEDGNYDVTLDFNNIEINREITVANNQLTKVGDASRAYGPYHQFENNMLKVSYLNNSHNNVLMNIYKDGKYVTGKRLGKEMCIQKVFDFSRLEDGQYEVVLSDRQNDYQFVVNK